MADSDEPVRAVARCEHCGNIVPVRIWNDGRIHPIGTGTTCSCGDDEFDVLNEGLEGK